MKKYIVIKSGRVVTTGDFVIAIQSTYTSAGKGVLVKRIKLTPDLIEALIKNGKLKEVENTSDNYLDKLWDTVEANLIEKTGWKGKKLANIIKTLDAVNPWATMQIILKEVAIELDKKYEDHINKSERIYAISPQDGRVHEINKKNIKTFKAFPAFRTIEDAKIACNLVSVKLRELFHND